MTSPSEAFMSAKQKPIMIRAMMMMTRALILDDLISSVEEGEWFCSRWCRRCDVFDRCQLCMKKARQCNQNQNEQPFETLSHEQTDT
jgi:hypothetical protein